MNAENRDVDIYFFDESRFGTHSKIGRGWFIKGLRTNVLVKLGFQNFYVYSAVDPNKGNDFTLIMPSVNTTCMNLFLKEMSENLGGKKALCVMDCAGWHKSKGLIVPDNIKLLYLPPYSPELNPIERFWQYLKSITIKNKIYDTLDTLEEVVCNAIKQLESQTLKSICSMDYLLN